MVAVIVAGLPVAVMVMPVMPTDGCVVLLGNTGGTELMLPL